MSGCEYIFKKGKNIGNRCNQKPCLYNFCRTHIKPYCNKWEKNKDVNPFTGGNITKNMYKTLEIVCIKSPIAYKSPSRNISVTKCKDFLKNKNINPMTGRTIKDNGALQKKLMKQCEQIKQLKITDYYTPKKSTQKSLKSVRKSVRKSGLKSVRSRPITRKSPRKKNPSISLSADKLRRICEEWFNNRGIDPISRKKIRPNFKIYKNLLTKCSELDDKRSFEKANIKKKNNNSGLLQISGLPRAVPKINDVVVYDDKQVKIPQQINNWILGKKLGNGGFGIVYECINIYDKKTYAIKVEHQLSGGLYVENKFYNSVRKFNNKHIPTVYDGGVFQKIRYMVIDKLYPFKFTPDRIPEIIEALQSFASMNRSHGDVKFDNMMQRETGELVLIDFGLSWQIKPSIFDVDPKHISGTMVFMSLYTHEGIVTYRNDLESLIYCILEIINKLPWDKKKFTFEDIHEVYHLKLDFLNKIMTKDDETLKYFDLYELPKIYNFIFEVMQLNKHEYPNYNLLKSFFK